MSSSHWSVKIWKPPNTSSTRSKNYMCVNVSKKFLIANFCGLKYFYAFIVKLQCTCTLIIIIFRWFPEVQNIFYNGNKRKQVPFTQLDAYFEGSAVLMTNLLRELALDSIDEYETVFCPQPVSL